MILINKTIQISHSPYLIYVFISIFKNLKQYSLFISFSIDKDMSNKKRLSNTYETHLHVLMEPWNPLGLHDKPGQHTDPL